MRSPITTLAIAFASAAISACRPTAPVRNGAQDAVLPSPEQAMAMLRDVGEKRRSLRAMGRLTYFGEKGRVRVKAVMVVERPSSFRFETISPMEQPIDVMASDGKRLWLLSKEKLQEGPATPENVARLLPLPMYPEEIVDTLLGGVPTSGRFRPTAIEAKDDRWILTVEAEAQQKEKGRLAIDPNRKAVTRVELLEPNGDVRMSVSFDGFESVGQEKELGDFPKSIAIKIPRRDLDVDIKLKEVDVNQTLDPGLFRITPPPGIVPERLDSPPRSSPKATHKNGP